MPQHPVHGPPEGTFPNPHGSTAPHSNAQPPPHFVLNAKKDKKDKKDKDKKKDKKSKRMRY
jgi:hypothetical protein